MFLLIIILAAIGFAARRAGRRDPEIMLVLFVSSIYYCLSGTIYWVYSQNSTFDAVFWGPDAIFRAANILAASTLGLIVTISFFSSWFPAGPARQRSVQGAPAVIPTSRLPSTFWPCLAAGLGASVLVLVQGSFAREGVNIAKSPLFLIGYQFSDLLVPVILYLISAKGYTRVAITLIAYFTFYAVLVGFRYKLALLFFPILLDQIAASRQGRLKINSKTIALAILIGLVVMSLFTFMTLFRNKFGVPDLHRKIRTPVDDMMWGLFAETDTILGFSSILKNYLDTGLHFMLSPVIDIFKEWIPRILFPSRVTGEYLIPMQLGFLSAAGITSGTAYPWIGEFVISFGYPGFVIGPLSLAALYVFLKRAIARRALTLRQYAIGCANLGAVMGFYHFSRGYLPQISKAYVFIVLPYIWLCYSAARARAQTAVDVKLSRWRRAAPSAAYRRPPAA
jgi:hypothetical protein